MTEDKVRSFGFSTQAGADLFVARLDRKAYARVTNGDLKIGDFHVKRDGDEIEVLVFPMSPKEVQSLQVDASTDRDKAGEPKRAGAPVKAAETAEPAKPTSKRRARAARAAKADVARKAARTGALAHLASTTKPAPPPTPDLAVLIADYEARRDRLQAVINHLRSAEAAMVGA